MITAREWAEQLKEEATKLNMGAAPFGPEVALQWFADRIAQRDAQMKREALLGMASCLETKAKECREAADSKTTTEEAAVELAQGLAFLEARELARQMADSRGIAAPRLDSKLVDDLHVFYLDSAEEWVVASSEEDAWREALLVWGGQRADYVEDEETFAQEPDDKPLKIMCNSEGHPDESGEYVTLTCGEWAKREGRGLLCSHNY